MRRVARSSFLRDFAAPAVSALAFVLLVAVFVREASSFRRAVVGWAERDLEERASMVASSLREPLETGDFQAIHSIGSKCEEEGLRMTVFSLRGGLVFDSSSRPGMHPDEIYASAPLGGHTVRIGIPRSRVLAPFRRARLSFALAAFAGGAGVMLVFFFSYRQRVRIRELARLEKFRSEFIADFSHELKTPLTGIIGAADLLDDDAPPDVRRRLVAMMRGESKRLDALARGILDLAKLERSDAPHGVERVDLRGLVKETAERFEVEAREKGVDVSWECGDELSVEGDRGLLERAVSNLVVNALRHSGSRTVRIAAERKGRRVEVSVEDHGRGIPSEHASRVFERFYRVDSSREGTGGSGLGLAIVKRIAEMHGGSAALEASHPSGCRFIISLPVSGGVRSSGANDHS